MKTKRWIIFFASLAGVIAIICGLCFFFLGNKLVKDVPQNISVQQVDKDFILTTQYADQYSYRFKLEQKIDDVFKEVANIDSQTNSINLSEQKFDLTAGNEYRFSACYVTENGVTGKYCQALEWRPTWQLTTPASLNYDDNQKRLSWSSVNNADFYLVLLIDHDGKSQQIKANSNEISLLNVTPAAYTVHVFAKSNNDFITSSQASMSLDFKITAKNEITSVDVSDRFSVFCLEKAEEFSLYVDGELYATIRPLETVEGVTYEHKFDFSILTDILDRQLSIQAKSSEYVLESQLFEIAV